jgi:hypothetical protein
MTANDYESYRLAILIKLIREIAGAPTARRWPSGQRQTAAATPEYPIH